MPSVYISPQRCLSWQGRISLAFKDILTERFSPGCGDEGCGDEGCGDEGCGVAGLGDCSAVFALSLLPSLPTNTHIPLRDFFRSVGFRDVTFCAVRGFGENLLSGRWSPAGHGLHLVHLH